ncbi:efflux RND transporter periplasmic adaptor subunit [Salinibacter altiplanensis]|uniref:efflux RND transporter periplasmic adaptor subunit n=1 Tax=Salinibacter altiplanensis TaxID=1803181 RepID=UPI000C9F784B|nr:efflux RND transporter periplasmic adaptor subunit [Salinibacter altiplanensis]
MTHRRFSFILAPLLIAALLLIGCGRQGAPPSSAQADTTAAPNTITLSEAQLQEVSVETTTVTERPVTTTLELPARVRPGADQQAYVTTLVSGRVERLRVSPGDQVRRGAVMADVAAPDLSGMVAALRQAHDELDRQRRLDERGVAVEKNLRAAERQWQAARQRLRSIGTRPDRIQRVATGQEDLSTLPLEAPLTGVVLDRMTVLGAPVAQGEKLYHIADLQPIRVVARVFEQSLDQVQEGQSVTITASRASRTYEGTIDRVTPQVEEESRTASARVVLDNTEGLLRPGMYATVRVRRAGASQPALPADVLLTDASGTYALVQEGPHTFRRAHVDADASADGTVAVPSLSPGTEVVTKGAYQIVSALNQRG